MTTNKVTVLYEYILKCMDFTNDKDWKDIFYSCACNKFPKGVRYDSSKNTLHVRYKCDSNIRNDTFIISQIPEECYNTLMRVFRDILDIRSKNDVNVSQVEIESLRLLTDVEMNCSWKSLKPKSIKNHILINFTIDQTLKCSGEVCPKTAMKLYRLIQLSFKFKTLVSNDVNYDKGKITSITGLYYNKKASHGDFPFMITNKPRATIKSEKQAKEINHMKKSIDKWASEYKRYYVVDMK